MVTVIQSCREPKVTVLTTTFNQAHFLPKCIASVQKQTFQNFEHIILDDGSTDNTEQLMKTFKDPRIIYVKRPHVGMTKLKEVYNHGLSLASGEFVTILEADDYYPSDKMGKQIPSMSGSVLSFGKVVEVDENGNFLSISPKAKQFKGVIDWLTPLLIFDYITALTVMMRKTALDTIGGFHQPKDGRCVDYYTFLKLAMIGKFAFIDEVMGYWVKHGKNLSNVVLDDNASLIAIKYSIAFCQEQGIPVPFKALSGQRGKNLFHVGRHHLLNGDKKKALSCFKQSLVLSSTLSKTKSVYGMILSIFNVNMEGLVKSLRRPMERT